ncbi:MAG: SH3 domain-containing protein [Rhizobiaceae bacterium]
MSLLFVEYLAGRAEIRAAKMAHIEARTRQVEDAQKVAERPAESAAPVTASVRPNTAPMPQVASADQASGQSPARPRRSSSFFAPSQAMADTFDDDPLADAPPLMAFAATGSTDAAGDEPMGEAGMTELPETVDAKPVSAERTAALAPSPDKGPSSDKGQTADGRAGSIVSPVTLRARPAKGAKPIGTVPAKTRVQVFECKDWCRIEFDGKSGWVYKSFVRPS